LFIEVFMSGNCKDCENYANEKEWRDYMLREIRELRLDFQSFKLRVTGVIAALVALVEVVKLGINKLM